MLTIICASNSESSTIKTRSDGFTVALRVSKLASTHGSQHCALPSTVAELGRPCQKIPELCRPGATGCLLHCVQRLPEFAQMPRVGEMGFLIFACVAPGMKMPQVRPARQRAIRMGRGGV